MQASTRFSVSFSASPIFSFPDAIEAIRVSISRRRDSYDTIEADIVWPGASFWSSGFRYMRIESDDDGTIAVGELVGIPVAMAGAIVTIEAACRAEDHTTKVKNALAPARARLARMAPDDEEALLDVCMTSLFVDPVGHEVTGFPFGGEAARAPVALYGEGSAVGSSTVLGIRPVMTSDPATIFTMRANARHVQQYTGQVAVDVPAFSYYGTLERAIDGGDADHVPLGLSVAGDSGEGSRSVQIRPAFVDPVTCAYIAGASRVVQKRRATGVEFRAAITSRVQRDETALFTVTTNIGPIPGARSDASDEVSVPDMTGVNTWSQAFSQRTPNGGSRTIRFLNTASSAFLAPGGTGIAAASQAVVTALTELAARRALEQVYVVEMQVDVPAEIALGVTTRDRCTVTDTRLPRGSVTGWVIGVEISLAASDSATITLLCPAISTTPVIAGVNISTQIGLTGGVVQVRRSQGAPAGYQPTKPGIFGAIEDGDGDFFVENVTVSDDASVNDAMFDQINARNATEVGMSSAEALASSYVLAGEITDYVKPPVIDVAWAERQISEEAVDEVEIAKITIVISGGGISFV